MTITFPYIEGGCSVIGSWNGDRAKAIRAAVKHLGAVQTKRGFIYWAEEAEAAYRVTANDMAEAGAAILSRADDWYSLWGSYTGVEVTKRTAKKYFGSRL